MKVHSSGESTIEVLSGETESVFRQTLMSLRP